MKQGLFEEFLIKKTADFSLPPKEGLWESIEEQLEPEKKKRRALWLWVPAGLSVFVTVALFYHWQYSGITKVSDTMKNQMSVKVQASDLGDNNLSSAAPVQTEHKAGKANGSSGKWRQGFKKSYGTIHYLSIDNLSEENNLPFGQDLPSAENKTYTAVSDAKGYGEKNLQNVAESKASVSAFTDTAVLNQVQSEPVDTSKKNNPVDDTAPAIIYKHTFYIGMMFTPLQSNSLLTLSRPDAPSSSVYQNRKETDRAGFGYGALLSAGYEKNRHHLYGGIQYQSLAYQMRVRNLETKKSVISSAALPKFAYVASDTFALTATDSGGIYVTGRFSYISVPLGYTFSFIKKPNFSVGITTNLSYHILLRSDALLYNETSGYYLKQNGTNNVQLMKSNFMLSGGLDFDYRLNRALVLTFRPQFGCTLKPAEKAAVSTGLKYWGLGMGLKWYLR